MDAGACLGMAFGFVQNWPTSCRPSADPIAIGPTVRRTTASAARATAPAIFFLPCLLLHGLGPSLGGGARLAQAGFICAPVRRWTRACAPDVGVSSEPAAGLMASAAVVPRECSGAGDQQLSADGEHRKADAGGAPIPASPVQSVRRDANDLHPRPTRSAGVTGRRTSVRQRGRGERGERECQRQRVLGRMVGCHCRTALESGGSRGAYGWNCALGARKFWYKRVQVA